MKTRKRILLSISALLVTVALSAQESVQSSSEVTNRHEVSIVIDDIFAKNRSDNPIYYNKMEYGGYIETNSVSNSKVGIGYKFLFNKSAIRSKVAGYIGNDNYSNGNTQKNDTKKFTLSANIGYEFHKNIEKTQLFFGVDFVFDYAKLNENSTSNYNFNMLPTTFTYKNSTDYQALGFAPLMGVKYFFTKNLSMSTELNCKTMFYNIKDKSESSQNPSNEVKNDGVETTFGPLGNLSINYAF